MSAGKSKSWLKVVGIGENGLEGLSPAARQRVESAEILFGGKRHLEMIPGTQAKKIPWAKRMREAVNTLEDRWLERRASLARQAAIPALKSEAMAAHLPEGGVLYGEQEEWLANKLQAASRGMIARRQLQPQVVCEAAAPQPRRRRPQRQHCRRWETRP